VNRELRSRVLALRAEGVDYQTIAGRLGVSLSYARRLGMSEAALLRWQASSAEAKRRRTGRCRDCGAVTRYNGRVAGPASRCLKCAQIAYWDGRRGQGSTQRRILDFLDGRERRCSEIRDGLGITNANVAQQLHRLLHYGLIVRVRRGVYRSVL
jgi:Helix-turn-helix domain